MHRQSTSVALPQFQKPLKRSETQIAVSNQAWEFAVREEGTNVHPKTPTTSKHQW